MGVQSNDTELVVVVLPDPSERLEYIATIQNWLLLCYRTLLKDREYKANIQN